MRQVSSGTSTSRLALKRIQQVVFRWIAEAQQPVAQVTERYVVTVPGLPLYCSVVA